ncbi:MAG: amidohydrolase family protein [Candidatus Hydrogenedentes bacterium]|nr:amidohydrolase family protein [Candidatus Hydrogenedentota bacterium]
MIDRATWSRRAFLAAAGAAAGTLAVAEKAAAKRTSTPGELPFADLPNFCAHEHWGSFDAIGHLPEGFRADVEPGALPKRRVTVLDLVLDPYFGGWLSSGGFNVQKALENAVSPPRLGSSGGDTASPGGADVFSWWGHDPRAVFNALRPALEKHFMTGVFQCTRRGTMRLHKVDLGTLRLDDWIEADAAIGCAYSDIFAWYASAMARMNFRGLIRPMQPEFYFREDTGAAAQAEAAFTRSVLRIDPFLKMWKEQDPRRDWLAQQTGIDPVDAATWRAFLQAIVERAAARGAVGIKQLQAYSRNLAFPARDDAPVVWRGELDTEHVQVFQDWVVNACCALAHERRWIHQVHVGTNNLDESTPLPLEGLARRYGNMPVVMIHCWPFLKEAGWLAKMVPNIYIDTCWQPVLNPRFLHDSFEEWLNYVPWHKIMLSHDSTSVEMAAGSALFTREALEEALRRQRRRGLSRRLAEEAAAGLLYGNAERLYGD